MSKGHGLSLVLGMLVTLGCSSSDSKDSSGLFACTEGAKKCACYGNGTCDEGLVCNDKDICVAEAGQGGEAGDQGTSGHAGEAGEAGAATEEGGRAGEAGSSSERGGSTGRGGSSSQQAGSAGESGSQTEAGGSPGRGGASSSRGGATSGRGGSGQGGEGDQGGAGEPGGTTSRGGTTSQGGTSTGVGGGSGDLPTATTYGKLPYRGVNLASAEFGPESAGVYGTDYVYPIPAYVEGYDSPAYYVNKGMNTFRLPFLWERLQPTLDGAFDATELERLTTTVDYLTSMRANVIVDPHNYARYFGDTIGSSAVPSASFVDFWSRLADQFRSNPYVIFGVMNEPHDMDVDVWVNAANAAIAAIRATEATNLVLVPGSRWTGAHSWYNSDLDGSANASALLDIYDSGDNMAVEVHQYLDAEMSGTASTCQSTTIGSESLYDFTGWLATYGMHGFLGEFGGGANATCLAAIDNMLSYLEANSSVWIGWTYWAGGPIWPVDYMTSLEPSGDVDTAQMDTLEPHLTDEPEPTENSLPIDATGWVPASSNDYGIQGPWYWFSDADDGYGQTEISNVVVGAVPFETGLGMCLSGTTPGGYDDDYETWGAVIALDLNQATPEGEPGVLVDGPSCYKITVTGIAPAGFRAKLSPTSPLNPTYEAPGIDVPAGTFDLCISDVSEPEWCATSSTMFCLSPDSLTDGVATLSVQANAGELGGTIDFCVTAVVAHD